MEALGRVEAGSQLDSENPWPGLDVYSESTHDFFSGRGLEIDDLRRRIVDEPITVLFGKSGLGKSSLLKAGVFPHIRENGLLPIFIRLQARPGVEPLIEQVRLAVFNELRTQGVEHPESRSGETLWEYVHRTDLELWTAQNQLTRPVLVFDQFEELFTLGRAVRTEVDAFREDLSDLAENRVPAALARRLEALPSAEAGLDVQAMPYKIVISLREDFLADLEEWRVSMPSLRRNRMRLLPMRPDQALQAICNERTKHLVSEPLALKIVAFLASGAATFDAGGASESVGSSVEPALLSLFCQGVNEHRRRDGKAVIDEALLEGGKGTIVADFYRTSLADQPERVRQFIEEELITEHGFRNSYSVDDARARGSVTASELDTLINRHLLRHEHHLGTDRVELTHDLLTKAVVDERDGRRRAEAGRRERRQRWKLAVVAGASVLAALIFGGLAIAACTARNSAKAESARSRSKELAGLSAAAMDGDPDLAVRLALEGLQRAQTADAWSALLNAAQYAWPSAMLDKAQLVETPNAVALSADGSRLAVLAGRRTITLWDVTARKPVQAWSVVLEDEDKDASSLAFSPDQTLLAIGRRAWVDLLDATTGSTQKHLPQLPPLDTRVVAFSPDGRWLVSTQQGRDLRRKGGDLQLLDFRNERPTPVVVRDHNVSAFVVLAGGKRIMAVNTTAPMSAYWLELEGTHWNQAPIDLSGCMKPQSVSPGAQQYSATWKARTCIAATAGGQLTEERGRADTDPTFDIIWSPAGRAFAELLVSEDLIVGRIGPAGTRWESHIKGAHPNNSVSDKSQLISLDELGTRVALIDEHELVRVYQLADHKLFLSRLEGTVGVAPDGRWIAVASRSAGDSAAIDVIPLKHAFESMSAVPVQTRIAISARPTALYATPSSLVAVLSTDPPTSVVFDAATGKRKAEPYVGDVRPIGADGELLLIDPPAGPMRVVKTGDGSAIAPWEQSLPGSGPLRFVVSPGRQALAVLRANASNATRANAFVYSIHGDTLVPSGPVQDVPADLLTAGAQLADDGTAITYSTGRGSIVTRLSNANQLRPTLPVEKQGVQVSPLGRYEYDEPVAGAPLSPFRVVKRDDKVVLGPFRSIGEARRRFSNDERWLVSWSSVSDEVQIVDLERGEIAFGLTVHNLTDVNFEGRNSILHLGLGPRSSGSMLIPLDRALMEQFAKWLAPNDLTPNERCDYGFGGKDCGKDGVTPRAPGAHPERSDK